MTDPEQDFEAYLQRRPVLPALDDTHEPPAALDEKVLAQARAAIQPTPSTDDNVTSLRETMRPMQRAPRWAVPVALAATILLCLSVVMNISLNRNEPSTEVVIPRAMVASAPTPHPPVVAEARGRAETRVQQFKQSLAETDTPVSGTRRSADTLARQSTQSPAGTSNAAPAPASGAMASANRAASVAPIVEGGASAEPRDEASDARTDLSAADKAVLMAKEAGAVAPEGTPAPEAERTASRQMAKKADMAPRATGSVTAAPPAAKPSGSAAGPQDDSQHPADPKVWLQQIDALRKAGKIGQADAEMRRFKAAFPNYTLPK